MTTGLLAEMDQCQMAAQGGDVAALVKRLGDADWRLRYAAAVALGDCGPAAKSAVDALMAQLRAEDAAPLYTQPGDLGGGPAGANTAMQLRREKLDPLTRDAWARRGRIKQAILWALAAIGVTTPEIREHLGRYAVNQNEDYTVRAAACRALGVLGDNGSVPTLRKAATDAEWCTQCEAHKSLRKLHAQ